MTDAVFLHVFSAMSPFSAKPDIILYSRACVIQKNNDLSHIGVEHNKQNNTMQTTTQQELEIGYDDDDDDNDDIEDNDKKKNNNTNNNPTRRGGWI